jgi:hypothetical protein
MEGGKHIEAEILQFKAEIEPDHVVRRDHQHHADGRKQDHRRIFEAVEAGPARVAHRHDESHGRADQGQHLHQPREGIEDESAAERLATRPRPDQPDRRGRKENDGQHVDEPGCPLSRIDADHQDDHGAGRENHLGQREGEARGEVCGHRAIACCCTEAVRCPAWMETVTLLTRALTEVAVALRIGAG